MIFASLIWPALDAKRFAALLWSDPITRLEFWLAEMDQ